LKTGWLNVRYSAQPGLFNDGRLIVWFSCGAASACALKMVAELNPVAMYCDCLSNEHEDNARFLADIEAWTGVSIEIIKSDDYSSVEDVFKSRRYMSGIAGAPCTVELKKVPRFRVQRPDDIHVFGFTCDEKKRIVDFNKGNFDLNLAWPLAQKDMTKQDCFDLLDTAGINLPKMYELGYKNNNCIGCVKATSPDYWNLVRRTHPKVFKKRCEQSREIGCKLTRYKGDRIYLDQLPADSNEVVIEDLSCGPQCGVEPSTQENTF